MPNASTFALRLATLALTGALCFGALAQESAAPLEERMSEQEFREAGLHKLSEAELAALNRWLGEQDRSAATTESAQAAEEGDQRGFSKPEPDTTIESRIAGTFRGWRGSTSFELENGMVWRQAESGTFAVPAMENPEVSISPGLFGTWHLSVEGYSRRVRVERVR